MRFRAASGEDGTRRFWFGGFFHMLGAWERHRFNGDAVAVCSEGGCGSGNAKQSFAGRIPKRRVCEKISCYNTKVIATLLNH